MGAGDLSLDLMLERLKLKRFTVFKETKIAFTRGINVFIGANSTGKTHAMKVAYALAKSTRDYEKRYSIHPKQPLVPSYRVAEKISSVFRPMSGDIERLIRRQRGRLKATVELEIDGGSITYEFSGTDQLRPKILGSSSFPECTFLPAREVLSLYPGFLAAYQNRELAFDETYYDLCLALSAAPLRGPLGEEAAALSQSLGVHLRSNVVLINDSFYLNSEDDGLIEAHFIAEGVSEGRDADALNRKRFPDEKQRPLLG